MYIYSVAMLYPQTSRSIGENILLSNIVHFCVLNFQLFISFHMFFFFFNNCFTNPPRMVTEKIYTKPQKNYVVNEFVCLLFDCVLFFFRLWEKLRGPAWQQKRKLNDACLEISMCVCVCACVHVRVCVQHYVTFLKFVLCKCFHTYIWEGLYIFF